MHILKDQPIRRQVLAITCTLLVPFIVAEWWSANRSRIENADELRDKAMLLTRDYDAAVMNSMLNRLQQIEAEASLDWICV